jgi:TPP-dependent pyruvate/acetoin dehydrogenase alpha subunit
MTKAFKDLSADKLLDMYRMMVLSRRTEEKFKELFLTGTMPGTLHQSTGEEALAVGSISHLKPDDYLVPTHRPVATCLTKGLPLDSLFAEFYGKKAGCCQGKGGSIHIGDINYGIVLGNGILGANVPQGAGIALVNQLQKNKKVVIVFFGDGASNEGAVHEGMNLAAVWKLPVVFVCVNNRYGASTYYKNMINTKSISERGKAYGIPSQTIDGTEIAEVYDTFAAAIEKARKNQGPSFIESLSYRMVGHSRRDPANYRQPGEKEEMEANDPVAKFKEYLLKKKLLDQEKIDKIEEDVADKIAAAVQFAQDAPFPEPEEALVY